jgi:hypothetical protein
LTTDDGKGSTNGSGVLVSLNIGKLIATFSSLRCLIFEVRVLRQDELYGNLACLVIASGGIKKDLLGFFSGAAG